MTIEVEEIFFYLTSINDCNVIDFILAHEVNLPCHYVAIYIDRETLFEKSNNIFFFVLSRKILMQNFRSGFQTHKKKIFGFRSNYIINDIYDICDLMFVLSD